MTGQDMCETIVRADILRKADGSASTGLEIWNYSPRGELFMIWEWYEEAQAVLLYKATMEPEWADTL